MRELMGFSLRRGLIGLSIVSFWALFAAAATRKEALGADIGRRSDEGRWAHDV